MSVLADPVAPTEHEAELAQESSRRLAPYAGKGNLRVDIRRNGRTGESIELPAVAVQLLLRILSEMANGNAITLLPIHAQLTTQQAADLLNVSRPYLVKLLDQGRIRHHKVGAHRRILFSDLMEFKRKSDQEREEAMAALVADAQEQGLGY